MPKLTHVLRDFSKGMIGSVSATDLPDAGSPFLLDVDVSGHLGKIKSREQDTEFTTTGAASIVGVGFIEQINGNPLMCGSGAAATIGQYPEGGAIVGSDTITGTATDLIVHNHKAYISEGSGTTPEWYGKFGHNNWKHAAIKDSWGVEKDEEVTLSLPNNAYYVCEDGTCAYWAEKGGRSIYKSTNRAGANWTECLEDQFIDIRGIACDGTYIYVLDCNRVIKLDNTPSIVASVTIDTSGWLLTGQYVSGLAVANTYLIIGSTCTDISLGGHNNNFSPFVWIPIAAISSHDIYDPRAESTGVFGMFRSHDLSEWEGINWATGERVSASDGGVSQSEFTSTVKNVLGRVVQIDTSSTPQITIPENALFHHDNNIFAMNIKISGAVIPVILTYDTWTCVTQSSPDTTTLDDVYSQTCSGGLIIAFDMDILDNGIGWDDARLLSEWADRTATDAVDDANALTTVVGKIMPYAFAAADPANSWKVLSQFPAIGSFVESERVTLHFLFYRVPGEGDIGATAYANERLLYSNIAYDDGWSSPTFTPIYNASYPVTGFDDSYELTDIQVPALLAYNSGGGAVVSLTAVGSAGNADLATFTFSSDGAKAFAGLSVSETGSIGATFFEFGGKGELAPDYTYRYAISFTYDGYQEGQLVELQQHTVTQENAALAVKVAIKAATDIGKRVSHVNLYRSQRYGTGADFVAAPYRLVETVEAIVALWPAANIASVSYNSHTFYDTGKTGASYEALAGITETLTDVFTPPNGLTASLHGYRLVANVNHACIEDDTGVILRSRQNRPSVFDWVNDIVRTKGDLTAMVAFNNRIYAFDKANMYRINIDSLYVEDETSGIGIASQSQVCVTEFGMLVATKHNIYLHDGAKLVPIGEPILSNDLSATVGATFAFSSVGYKDNQMTPVVGYDAYTNSFYISFEDSHGTTKALFYVYNLANKTWTMRSAVNCELNGTPSNATNDPVCMGNTDDGDLLIAVASKVYKVGQSTAVTRWLYVTKNMMLNEGAKWKLYDAVKDGVNIGSVNIYYWTGSAWSNYSTTLNQIATQLALLAANTPELDSLSLLYRPLGKHDATT